MNRDKVIWWALLAVGMGGCALFALIISIRPSPLPEDYGFEPPLVAKVALVVVAALKLWSLYRLEPLQGGGRWQLSLTDLLIASFATGLLLAITRALCAGDFLPWGAVAAIGCGLLFVAGQLVGTRHGIDKAGGRAIFALGFVATVCGALGTGAFVVVLAMSVLFGQEHLLFGDLFRLHENSWMALWLIMTFCVAIASLTLGLLLCAEVRRACHAGLPNEPTAAGAAPDQPVE